MVYVLMEVSLILSWQSSICNLYKTYIIFTHRKLFLKVLFYIFVISIYFSHQLNWSHLYYLFFRLFIFCIVIIVYRLISGFVYSVSPWSVLLLFWYRGPSVLAEFRHTRFVVSEFYVLGFWLNFPLYLSLNTNPWSEMGFYLYNTWL